MAEFLANPDAFHYAPSSSPPSSPIPWDTRSPEMSDDEQDRSSPWRLASDPYSANAKATQSPLVYSQNTRQSYALPLTPSSSFANYGPPSPSPAPRNKPSIPQFTSANSVSKQSHQWEAAIDNAFQTGASIINLDNSDITVIPRTIIDLNNMVSWPGEPAAHLPPLREPDTPIRSNIAAAAARSRRVFSQTQSNNSLFSGTPSKSKREWQLYLANNSLTVLPSELFALKGLTLLSLRANKLRELPPAIGNMSSLRSLNIANNELTYLPAEITFLRLQTLLLDPNPFIPRPSTNTITAKQTSSNEGHSITRTPTSEHSQRTLAPLVTHNKVPTLRELALRVTLRPAQQIPKIPPLSFATTPAQVSAAAASRSLLTPTTSHSSVFSTPTQTSALSRSPSASSPYNSHPFPPHALLVSDLYDITSWLSGPLPKADVYIRAAMQGTDDARELYSWCPGKRHEYGKDMDTDEDVDRSPSSGLFVKPTEERFEWVTSLAGCDLPSAVPILWRGCSAGCLDFLDGVKDRPVLGEDTHINNEREDEEFISMFGADSAKNQVAPSEDEEEEEMVEAQTQIIWDDMMDLDDREYIVAI